MFFFFLLPPENLLVKILLLSPVIEFNLVHTKHSFVIDVLDAEPEARWERAHQDVEVKEEGDPRRRLVLRHGCYDGDVDLSVAGGEEEDS